MTDSKDVLTYILKIPSPVPMFIISFIEIIYCSSGDRWQDLEHTRLRATLLGYITSPPFFYWHNLTLSSLPGHFKNSYFFLSQKSLSFKFFSRKQIRILAFVSKDCFAAPSVKPFLLFLGCSGLNPGPLMNANEELF